jgi:hypothetical protein
MVRSWRIPPSVSRLPGVESSLNRLFCNLSAYWCIVLPAGLHCFYCPSLAKGANVSGPSSGWQHRSCMYFTILTRKVERGSSCMGWQQSRQCTRISESLHDKGHHEGCTCHVVGVSRLHRSCLLGLWLCSSLDLLHTCKQKWWAVKHANHQLFKRICTTAPPLLPEHSWLQDAE